MTHRRRRAALVLVMLAVSAAACGDGDDADAPGPSSTTTTVTALPTTTADTGGPSSTTSTGGGAGATSTTRAMTTSTRAPVSTAPNTSVPAEGSDGAASRASAPGRYLYATTGSLTASVGGTQRRDGETVLVVDPPNQGRQHSARQGPGGRSVDQTLELRPDGLYAVAVKIAESGFSQETRPSPPVLALPSPAPVGRTWSWKATTVDGRTTIDSAFRVVRTEAVTVGTESVPASVIEATITTGGEVVSTGRQTLWFSPGSSLIVKQQETTTGRLGLITFSSESTDTLLSLRPA